MEKLEEIKREITDTFSKTTDIQLEVKQIVDYFKEITKKLNKLYTKLDEITQANPYEQNPDLQKFSLITENLNTSLEFYETKSKNYEINYSLIKFFNLLFTIKYFYILNSITDQNQELTLINFLNISLKILYNFRTTLPFQLIFRKVHLYLNYIMQKKKNLSSILNELRNGFSIPHTRAYKEFPNKLQKSEVLTKCASDSCKYKEEGINLLATLISEGVDLAEQFELLTLSGPDIINTLLKMPNDEYAKAYGRFGNLLCSLLYLTKFQITIDVNTLKQQNIENSNDNVVIKSNFNTETENFKLEGNLSVGENYGKKKNKNDEDEKIPNNVTYIFDDKVIESDDIENYFNCVEKKLYELTYQKELLELNEQILDICFLYIDLVIVYDKIFPLQYISYLILKRIYFSFPKYIPEISDKIVQVLLNLSKFQGQFEFNTALESRQFAYYLLVNDKIISKKIKSATALSPYDIRYQLFLLQKTNLNIGFNNWVTVFAGKMVERKIDVMDENTLVYISINMAEDDDNDINIIVDKYDGENNLWNTILMKNDVEFSEGLRKIIIYSKEPSLYRILFDNTDAWIATKNILYRIVYLKPSESNNNN